MTLDALTRLPPIPPHPSRARWSPSASARSHPPLANRPIALGPAAVGQPVPALLTHEEFGFDPETGRYAPPKLPYSTTRSSLDRRPNHGNPPQQAPSGLWNGLNRALDKLADIRSGTGDAGLIKHWSRASFHGSGHVNHAIFWQTMAPPARAAAASPAAPSHDQPRFRRLRRLQDPLRAASKAVEASGWGWLVYEPTGGRLLVIQGEKQQNLMMTGVVPLLGIDVWEHAYYLKYQNRRAEYVDAFSTS